jgi:hypothetical protein
MAFSRSSAFSYVEENYSGSADYDDSLASFLSDTDSATLQFDVSSLALGSGWDVEENYLGSADYDDSSVSFFSDTESTTLQSNISPPALGLGWNVGSTIDPTLVQTQHQDLENCPNSAAPIQHF